MRYAGAHTSRIIERIPQKQQARNAQTITPFFLFSLFPLTLMDEFEAFLEKASSKGAHGIPGAVAAVVDQNGMSLSFDLPH
jgi:hypothetical protein